MRNTKFITLLGSLSNREFKDFERYITSFYVSRKKEIIVFNAITIKEKGLNRRILNQPKKLYDLIKKKGVYLSNLNELNKNILPKLVQILEEFLMWRKFNKLPDDYQKEKLRLLIYEEKNLSQLYANKVNNLIETIDEQQPSTIANLNLLDVYDYIYFKNANQKKFINKKEIDLIHQLLDAYFIEKKLKYASETILFQGIYGDTSTILFLDEIKINAKKTPFKDNNLNEINLLIIELSEQLDIVKYKQLKQKIKSILPQIPKLEQGLYYVFLMNYISKALKAGNNLYVPEIQDWVNYGVQSDFILENGFLPLPLFLNFVSVICVGKNFGAAKTFIENNSQFLNDHEQEVGETLGRAEIKFRKKEFDSIVQKLSATSFLNPIVKLRAKMLIMMTLFEEDETSNQLIDYIHSFENQCRRTKNLGEDNKQAALNLIKFTKKLLKEEFNKEKFKDDLNNLKVIFFKSWLIEKVDKL